jgi:subtilisin-like proprotein convertase family protein
VKTVTSFDQGLSGSSTDGGGRRCFFLSTENLMKRLWLPVAAAVLAAAGCSSDAPTTNPDDGEPQLSPQVVAQMEAILAEKAARTPAQQKISSSLLYARSGRFAATLGKDPERQIKSLAKYDAQGRALVDIQGDMSQLAGAVDALGGAVVKTSAHSQRAWMPLDKMEDLATNPAVRAVRQAFEAMSWRTDGPGAAGSKFRTASQADRVAAVQAAIAALNANPPKYPVFDASGGAVNVGAATTEGDKAHAADHARNFFGVDGTGVKIGVLSTSDDFKEQSIASGDLPADTVTVPGESGRPGSGEGTAMMEIVHDIAPGAKLFFATAFNGPESFADNIRTLRNTYGCDILIDDVIYFFESPWEDDIIAQAVNDVTASGAMYFSSAGNEGNFDDGTSGTWEGDFKAAGALATLPSGYTVHSFGNGAISNRVEDTPFTGGPLILHWSDPGTLALPASSNDYDLFVLDNDLRNVLLAATDIQAGAELPFEFLGFFIPGGFRVVIAAKPGAELRAVRTVLFGGEFGISTSGATYGHSATVDGFGVAAVDSFEADGGEFTAGPTTPVEVFSSDGPRRIFYRPDNTPINADKPGVTFASGGGNTRAKPDISAADGVSTTLPPGSGLNPFFGTSAAAPHAGAIAGLIKSALPNKTPAQIRSALLTGAIDIEGAGNDRNAGRGIVSAFAGLKNAGAKGAINLRRGAVQVIPLGTDVVLPGGAAQVNVAVDNIGGGAASGGTATLTSSSPDVLILQGASAYPTIPPESTGTKNTTPFAFFVSPSTVCGSLLPFTFTLSLPGGRTLTFGFSVPTGRAAAPQHFAYAGPPVAIPDANAAGVNIPLTVGFAGAVAKVAFNIDGATCTAAAGSTTVGVDHTWVGDLVFRLTAPDGLTTATLFSRPGGNGNSGNNFCQTVLTDGAASSIQDIKIAQAPFTGTFSAVSSLDSSFKGISGNGDWTLHAEDDAGADIGSVRAFSLDVSGFSCTP